MKTPGKLAWLKAVSPSTVQVNETGELYPAVELTIELTAGPKRKQFTFLLPLAQIERAIEQFPAVVRQSRDNIRLLKQRN